MALIFRDLVGRQPRVAVALFKQPLLPDLSLALGGEPLALARAITALGIDFGKPEPRLAVVEFADCHFDSKGLYVSTV